MLLDAEIERLIGALRGSSGGVEPRDLNRLIDRLCADFLRRWIDDDRELRRTHRADPEMQAFVYRDLLENESERMQDGDRSQVVSDARSLLERAGVELEEDDLDRLCWELQRALLRAYRITADEWDGDFVGKPRPASASHDTPGGLTHNLAEGSEGESKLLSEVIEAWIRDHAGNRWNAKTTSDTKRVVSGVLLQLLGDRPIAEIRREDVRGFRAAVENLPKRSDKVWQGRTAREVLELKPTPGGLSQKTVKKWLGFVAGFFKWAEREDYISKSPATGMMPNTRRHEQVSTWLPFADDDLRQLFTAEYTQSTLDQGKYGKYWVPLLCLFTGARVTEMAQLGVVDVVEVDGTPAIKIREGANQKLKTLASARTVPIHSRLVELGFLDYVGEARGRRWESLFPELITGAKNGPGDIVSKWFGRWRRRCGITDRRKVLHSCRHTIADRMKQQNVEEYVIAEILGHENPNISTGRYGGRLDVQKLAKAIELLDYGDALEGLGGGQRIRMT